MQQQTADALGALRTSSARLNALTDTARDTILLLEDFLSKECSVGCGAYVNFRSEPTGAGSAWETGIAYERVGSRFRIAVARGLDDDGETWTITPWTECTRDLKLQALQKLPDLLQQIAKKVEEKITLAEQALTASAVIVRILADPEGK